MARACRARAADRPRSLASDRSTDDRRSPPVATQTHIGRLAMPDFDEKVNRPLDRDGVSDLGNGTAAENEEHGNEAMGAGAGALGGAAVGMAVGGPPGAVVGGVIGAAGGAIAGESTEGDDGAGAGAGGVAGG